MTNDELIKIAKAKLYNVKSGIEGTIQMMEVGTIAPHQAIEGLAALSAKAMDEYNRQISVTD